MSPIDTSKACCESTQMQSSPKPLEKNQIELFWACMSSGDGHAIDGFDEEIQIDIVKHLDSPTSSPQNQVVTQLFNYAVRSGSIELTKILLPECRRRNIPLKNRLHEAVSASTQAVATLIIEHMTFNELLHEISSEIEVPVRISNCGRWIGDSKTTSVFKALGSHHWNCAMSAILGKLAQAPRSTPEVE